MKRIIPLSLAALLTPTMVGAQVIVNDSWADGDRTNTGPLQADWWSSSSTSGNSIEVGVGYMGLVTGTSGRGLHGTFAAQTLGIGDSLIATFTFTTPATVIVPPGSGSPFRVALMDFNNAGLAADLSSSSSSVNPLYTSFPGYMVDYDVNTGAAADISFRKHNDPNTTGRWLGTTGEWTQISPTSPDAGYAFTPDTEYVGVFSITRTGLDSVDLYSSLSQGATLLDSHTVTDSSAIANNIGVIGFWVNSNIFGDSNVAGEVDNGIDFLNIQVEVVPEPASAALLLAGALLLGGSLRRKA